MDIQGYLSEIRALAASGQATEHSYRPALERLFTSIDDGLEVINEPKGRTEVGAPDFVFNRGGDFENVHNNAVTGFMMEA
jgi:hypothetical protein